MYGVSGGYESQCGYKRDGVHDLRRGDLFRFGSDKLFDVCRRNVFRGGIGILHEVSFGNEIRGGIRVLREVSGGFVCQRRRIERVYGMSCGDVFRGGSDGMSAVSCGDVFQ